MARPELGTKRHCGACGAKFYDLGKVPIVCPKCATVVEPVNVSASASARREAVRAPAPAAPVVVDEAAADDVDIVSLQDVEADETADLGDDDIVVDDDDADIEDEDAGDAFLEDDEDEDDVTGLLGGGIAGEDEEV